MNFVCPKCHRYLQRLEKSHTCNKCQRSFPEEEGFLNFLTYKRNYCPTDVEMIRREEEANTNKVHKYLIPLFKKLCPGHNQPLKLLSIGCGSAIEVDEFYKMGYEAWGADAGERAKYWSRRHSKNIVIADGRALPFPNNYFDVVMNFGVLEHVDQGKPQKTRDQERRNYVSELQRVNKPGGFNIYGFPNRKFPIDFWHFKKFGMRWHSATNDYLASFNDLKNYLNEPGVNLKVLPLKNYFSFKVTEVTPAIKLFIKPFGLYHNLVSAGPQWLARSPLNPHLVILIKK